MGTTLAELIDLLWYTIVRKESDACSVAEFDCVVAVMIYSCGRKTAFFMIFQLTKLQIIYVIRKFY